MNDIATVWRGMHGTWQVAGPALLADDGLYTAVVLSLFTDGLADEADEVPGRERAPGGRRGWWGDAFADVPGDRIGSRLWLLARQKMTPQVLRLAEQYAREALQWLLDDGIARAVDVQAEVVGGSNVPGIVGLQVTVVRSAEPVARYRFEAFWKGA